MKSDLRPLLALAVALVIIIPGAYGVNFGGGISTSTSGQSDYSLGNTVATSQGLTSFGSSSGSTVNKDYWVRDLANKYAEIQLQYQGGTVTGYSNVLLPFKGIVPWMPAQISAEQKITAVNANKITAMEKASNKAGDVASTIIAVTQGSLKGYDGKASATATNTQTTETIGDATGATVELKGDTTYGSQGSHMDTLLTSVNPLSADFKGTTGATAGTGTSAFLNGNLAGALSSTWKANSLTKTRNSNGGAVEVALNTIAQTTATTASIDPAATFTVDQAWGGKIQSAIDAAWNGDTVNVVAGEYKEIVILNKALGLVGLGSGATTTSFTLNPGALVLSNSQGLTAPLVNVNSGSSILNGIALASTNGKVNVNTGTYLDYLDQSFYLKGITLTGIGNPVTSQISLDKPIGTEISGISANTVNVLNNQAKIQEGIGLANSGGTINVAAGTYTENVVLDKSLTINGAGDGLDPTKDTILNGNNQGSVFAIGTINPSVAATISGMTFTNGKADNGGGIYNRGTLTLNNVLITANTANLNGGGIYNTGTLKNMNGDAITYNTANGYSTNGGQGYTGGDGGGIYSTGIVNMNAGSSVAHNTANGASGGIANFGTVNMNAGSSIEYNYAVNPTLTNPPFLSLGNGGGIFNFGTGTVNMKAGSSINHNTADGEGGGICNGGTVNMYIGSSITANTAIDGGAIINFGTVTFKDSAGNDVAYWPGYDTTEDSYGFFTPHNTPDDIFQT